MSPEEQKNIKQRSRSASNDERTPLQNMNRKLNVGIAIVSILILIVTVTILNNRPTTSTTAESDDKPAEQQATSETPSKDAQQTEDEEPANADEAIVSEQGHTVSQSADANVKEVWTNEAWSPYATKQTGNHTSVFEEGHIDYEEKLAAAFSVLPIEREQSIVTSARNNGDAKSARIVVTTNDKSESYRVIINWIEGQGWLPTSVDVLYNVDGVR